MTAHDQRVREARDAYDDAQREAGREMSDSGALCADQKAAIVTTWTALESAIAARAEAPLRALLMTAMDICAEAGAAHQSYDFKARAQSTANQIEAALAAAKEGA